MAKGDGFESFFQELRSDLGDDNFRNFLFALSGRKPKEVKYHPEFSLHKALFESHRWRQWIHPELLRCLDRRENELVDLEGFEGLRAWAPGIFSFPCFTDEFCRLILEEVQHYQRSDLPERPPNSMNNYGLVLNEIGMLPLFNELLLQVMAPVAKRLFGDDEDRLSRLKEQPTIGNWGGSQLDKHHTFVVQYSVENDRNLDMHIDECDITFNVGLSESSDFQGNQLAFCGMYDADDHRKHMLTYRHVRGQCVVHCGKQRHGALDIQQGERASLIMWTKSHAYRRSDAYQARYDLSRWNLKSRDPICLSWSHDDDYAELMPPEEHFQMPPASSGWSFACHELSDGERRVVQLEGHRVLLLRHKGETYALEERCAHQGASLATGDLEDLADGPKLRCPVHGLCFDLRTGRAGDLAQRIYAVRSRDGDVEVAVRGRKRPIEAEPS